jgi:hypothetical protein
MAGLSCAATIGAAGVVASDLLPALPLVLQTVRNEATGEEWTRGA